MSVKEWGEAKACVAAPYSTARNYLLCIYVLNNYYYLMCIKLFVFIPYSNINKRKLCFSS